MSRKRNARSSAQGRGNFTDICSELKTFIAEENAKVVREIKQSNDKRVAAMKESLSFTIDSIKTLSDRHRDTASEISQLRLKISELGLRLSMLQLEMNDNRQPQERRLVTNCRCDNRPAQRWWTPR